MNARMPAFQFQMNLTIRTLDKNGNPCYSGMTGAQGLELTRYATVTVESLMQAAALFDQFNELLKTHATGEITGPSQHQ